MPSTLRFTPIQTGYSSEEMPGTIVVPVEGGGSRKRQDILLTGHIVNCQWLLNEEEYTEFMGFFDTELRYGREDFLLDLITDIGVPTTHVCRTVGGNPKLIQQKNEAYWVSCTLECDKNPTFTSTITYSIGAEASWVFDGVDDSVLVGDLLHFERTSPFSLSARINGNFTSDSRMIIANLEDNQTGQGYAFEIRVNDPVSGLFLELNNNSFNNSNCLKKYVPSSTFNLLDGQDHDVVVTYAGNSLTSGVKFYIDGTLRTSILFGSFNSLSASIVPTVDTNLRIGGRDAANFNYEGIIQDAAVWSVELSAAEVTELYSVPVVLGGLTMHSQAANLEAWYKIDGSDTTDPDGVVDYSGNGLHGTAQNGLGDGGAGTGQIVFSGIGKHFTTGDQVRVLNSAGIHPDGDVPLNLDGVYTVGATVLGNAISLDAPVAVNTDWNTLFAIDPSAEYGNLANGNVNSTVTKVPS